MPSVTGLSFDITAIKNADEAVKKLVKNAEAGIGKINKSWKDMTKDGLNHFIQRVGVAQRAMSQLSNARVNIRFSGQANDLKKLGDASARAITQVNKLITAMQQLSRLNINIVGTGGGTSVAAMDAQKIKYLEDQVKLLQEQLKIQQEIGKAVGAQVGNTNNVRNSMNGLGEAARKVRQIAGTLFSVQALMGYGNKLLQIRGEFEMQHRSLQVLLQDVDKANELWEKTVSLAVKSPFRVKELVTYTKQLAAYRVEADKLYETNRMLADVSAGLGVDMNRLILAFGQVKAANFLRGTELRQFSEAGVNMLEELAKRFTQLEGRAVSVGDVFERVSKRMVSFADVEAVFQTITSEGGTFYKMQEKQSETLRGMMMNLKDSIDLMFNEIGVSHDGVIKGSVDYVRRLVNNWRELIPIIKAIGVALIAGVGAKVILSSVSAVIKLGRAFKTAGTALSVLKNANVWTMLVSAVAGLITYLVAAKNKVDELAAAMTNIDVAIGSQLEESIALYRELAERVRDVTKSEEEQKDALGKLKNKFGEILPDQLLELEYIKGISDNYEDATNAMINYYNAKAIEQKKDKAESMYGEDIIEAQSLIIRELREQIEGWAEDGLIEERDALKLTSGIRKAVADTIEDAKNGEINSDVLTLYQTIRRKMEEYAGVEMSNIKVFGANPNRFIRKVSNAIAKYTDAIANVSGLPYENFAEQEAANIFLPEKENIEAVKNTFKEIINLVSEYSNIAVGEWQNLDSKFEAIVSKLPETAASYLPLLFDMFEKMKAAAASVEEEDGAFNFGKTIQNFQKEFTLALSDALWSQTKPSMASFIQDESGQWAIEIQDELVQLVTSAGETLRNEAEKLNLSAFQKSVVGAMEVIAEKTGVNVGKFAKFIPKIGDSLSTTRKAVEGEISLLKADITTWTNSLKVEAPELISLRPETLSQTQENIDAYTKLVEAFEMLWKYLGGEEKKKKGRTDNTIEERIKVVDQMNSKYKELNKTLSEAESLKGAFDAYKDAFATAYGREDVRSMSAEDFAKKVLNFPNEDEVVKWLDNLANTVKDKEDKIKVQLAKGKFEMDVDVRLKKESDEILKKEIEDMFDRYDLTLELDKIKAPKGFMKNLFGVDSMSLPMLRAEVESREEDFVGTDMEEDYKKFLEKIDDLERKELEQKAKRFVDYLSKNLDKIENIQRGRGLDLSFAQELFDEGKISAEMFGEAVQAIVAETNKEISKLNLEKFKESPEYIQAMGDMTAYSAEELRRLSSKLKDIIAENGHAFSAEELKVYHDALEKVNQRLEKLDKNLVYDKDIHNLKEIKRLNQEIADEKVKEAELNSKLIQQEMYRSSLIVSLENLQKQRDEAKAKGQDTTLLDSLILTTQREIAKANDDVAATQASLKSSKSLLAELGAELNRILNGETEAFAKLQAYVNLFNKSLKAFAGVFNEVKSVVDSFGVDTDSGVWAEMSVAMEGLSNVGSKAGEAVTKFMSSDPIGGTMAAISMVFEAIKGVNKIIDQRQETKIQKQLKQIESLSDEYNVLEKSMKKAFNAKELADYNAKLEKNVDLQLKAYDAAIRAEEAKKNTDPERIKELKEKYQALKEEWEEFKKSQLEDMGGVVDFRDATAGFVDAWREAFQETGNGLEGLKGNFKEFFADVVKQQALSQGATSIMKQLFDEINKSLEGDYTISEDEYKNIDDVQAKVLKELDAFLEGYYERYGDILESSEGGRLSALQKGIQGITEDTAQIIEAYLNSIRGYVSEQVAYTKRLYEMFDRMSRGNTYGLNVRMIS